VVKHSDTLTLIFHALADPVRRAMLARLAEGEVSLSELARPFPITLPAVMKHLKVLAAAGLVQESKTGRVRHCSLLDGPLVEAAVWINQHSHYWQRQFEALAGFLATRPQPVSNPKEDEP
jgi:DNA-binding transcriptional ArsR family regulator